MLHFIRVVIMTINKDKEQTALTYAVTNMEGSNTQVVDLNPEIFGVEIKNHIVAEVVRWQLAKRRAGTHSTLTRSEVRGTTKKCKPQKEQGTRHGDKRAPIFRKGGITHGPKPRSYEYSLNKKIKAMGLKIALSDRFNTKALIILEDTKMTAPKTAILRSMIEKMGVQKGLFVSDFFDDNFEKAMRNIPNCDVLPVLGLNVYDILKHKHLIITRSGLDALNVRLA